MVSPGAEIAIPELPSSTTRRFPVCAGRQRHAADREPLRRRPAVPRPDALRPPGSWLSGGDCAPGALADVLDRPGPPRPLADRDILFSVTAGSLAGRFGRRVRATTMALVSAGLVHNVASDAHDMRRPPGLAAGLRAGGRGLSGFGEITAWLTEGVPGALLGGGAPPPYPAPVKLSRGVGRGCGSRLVWPGRTPRVQRRRGRRARRYPGDHQEHPPQQVVSVLGHGHPLDRETGERGREAERERPRQRVVPAAEPAPGRTASRRRTEAAEPDQPCFGAEGEVRRCARPPGADLSRRGRVSPPRPNWFTPTPNKGFSAVSATASEYARGRRLVEEAKSPAVDSRGSIVSTSAAPSGG